MSDSKVRLAERTIQSKNYILYRYMEKYGYNYFRKVPQFCQNFEF